MIPLQMKKSFLEPMTRYDCAAWPQKQLNRIWGGSSYSLSISISTIEEMNEIQFRVYLLHLLNSGHSAGSVNASPAWTTLKPYTVPNKMHPVALLPFME